MTALHDLLAPSRLTHITDIGAKRLSDKPPFTRLSAPYDPMIEHGLCHVTGFEPQAPALADLIAECGPNETYLGYAVGDGAAHTLHVTRRDGLTSLLEPDPVRMQVLNLGVGAEIVERIPVQTHQLDDIEEIQHLDYLKIDIQGGELAVFQTGRNKLADCVVIHTEVSFAPVYKNQPAFGDVDRELRSQGFVPQGFAELHSVGIAPVMRPLHQLVDGDMVYVRNFFDPEPMTDEQLKHLALIAHYCYKSFDLALRCVQLLEERGAVADGTLRQYVADSVPAALGVQLPPEPKQEAAPAVAGDAHSIFTLAQQHFAEDEFAEAAKLYLQRASMGGDEQEVYLSLYRLAESMAVVGYPWQQVQDVYLRAYQSRPTRAEPLHAIARHLFDEGDYRRAYATATRAAEIPLPEGDLLVDEDVYAWGVFDVQAACAPHVLPLPEVYQLWARLLTRTDLPDDERAAIVAKRGSWVPELIETAVVYPRELVGELAVGTPDAEVTVSLIAGADRGAIERTLNSFLNTCTDSSRVGRFLVADVGLAADDRAALAEQYKFVEFLDCGAESDPQTLFAAIQAQIGGRYWLHLDQGWQFFVPENLITRLIAVLDAEPRVAQVGVNFPGAAIATGDCAVGDVVRQTPDAGSYVLAGAGHTLPAMFDTERLDGSGGGEPTCANLGEVLCVTAV